MLDRFIGSIVVIGEMKGSSASYGPADVLKWNRLHEPGRPQRLKRGCEYRRTAQCGA